jgi:hypothetical protein
MVQIHSPRPLFSLPRDFWIFVYTAVDDFVDTRVANERNRFVAADRHPGQVGYRKTENDLKPQVRLGD